MKAYEFRFKQRDGDAMNPSKVRRTHLSQLTDLPNVGPATAADLRLLGIQSPADVVGRDAYEMHAALTAATGQRQDPCVIDVFISITRFMQGEAPRAWWEFTAERKARLADHLAGSKAAAGRYRRVNAVEKVRVADHHR